MIGGCINYRESAWSKHGYKQIRHKGGCGAPLLLSTARLSIEKPCMLVHLSEIDQIYIYKQDTVFLHVFRRDAKKNLKVSSGMEILILDYQT